MRYLTPVLLVIITLCQLSCHDRDDDKKKEESKFITLNNITLEVISTETTPSTIVVESFSLLSVTTDEFKGNKYYTIEYSFDILNTASQPFKLTGALIQATLLKDPESIGAGGSHIADATIPPRDKHTITYSTNSSLKTDGLDIDGWTLRIAVNPTVTMNFLIHVDN